MKKEMKDKEKKEGNLSDLAKHAKMSALKGVHDWAAEDMKGKLDGMKKVSVMSNSEEGLGHGLDKAKEILAHAMTGHSPVEEHDENQEDREHMDDILEPKEMPEEEAEMEAGEDGEHEEEMSEGMEDKQNHEMPRTPKPEHDGMSYDDLSEDELDKKIAHLHMLKNKKRMGK